MYLSKVELKKLVVKAWGHEQLTEKESRKMLKTLWKKYWDQKLDSFQEKVVLCSYILSPFSKEERDNYIKEVLDRLTNKN